MGQIKPFYGTGYATGSYGNIYNLYVEAYWLASGHAMANVTCSSPYETLLDLRIPNPVHFYNFNQNLADTSGTSSGTADGTAAYIWGKHNYAASGTGQFHISNVGPITLPTTIAFWTKFDNRYINTTRTLVANVDQDAGNDFDGLLRIYASTNNRIGIKVFGATSELDIEMTGVPIISGDWQFHVIGIDATNQTGYYSTNGSGIVATSLTALGEALTTSVGHSGGFMGDYNGSSALGLLDSVAIFNTTMLTTQQIKALWYGGSGKYFTTTGWMV